MRGPIDQPQAAEAKDIPRLLALEEEFPEADRISKRSWKRFLKQPGCVQVLRDGDTLTVAAVLLFRKDSQVARIYSIAVAPSARGKGLGRFMLRYLEGLAVEKHCNQLSLEVRVSNTPAIGLYRGDGFDVSKRLAAYYDDGEDALRMTKSLRSDG